MIWQYIIAGALLIAAVIYLVRAVRRSFSHNAHDCPDCGVAPKPAVSKTAKSRR